MGDQRRRARRSGRWWLAAVALLVAGCTTVGGTAVIAPYRSPPLGSLASALLRSGAPGVLALSPDGVLVATVDDGRGICLRPLAGGRAPVCVALPITGRHTISAAFSSDGLTLAVGRDVAASGAGAVWLLDTVTGRAQAVPAVKEAGSAPVYLGMVWDHAMAGDDDQAATGADHLLLISNSIQKDGPRTRIVDVDPTSLIPRVVAQATGPYEFQSGYLAAGGPKVIFTVFRGDQLAPNLVVVDLDSGDRKEFGPLGANGTRLIPLAVSPDGRTAVVGSATYQHAGAPRLLDLATGRLTEIPGPTGDFVLASFSPNGAQVAVVSTVGTASSRIAVAPVAGGPARTLVEIPTRPSAAGRLTWSGRDVVGMEAPISPTSAASVVGSIVGWHLSG
ncbi:hypothetical protein ABIB25_004342 [Nakamurella sp. UYEF19]|uniref:WD40 repeat domain-containing protein n=1 Tax=Nakamurella sp. UYEF19 TaxID=1756392 RepID=UPI0033980DD8